MNTDTYDEHSIQILTQPEVTEIFEWAEIGALAHQYGMPVKLIERGFAACAAVGISPEYFVKRYLMNDRSVQFREDVDAAYRALPR